MCPLHCTALQARLQLKRRIACNNGGLDASVLTPDIISLILQASLYTRWRYRELPKI